MGKTVPLWKITSAGSGGAGPTVSAAVALGVAPTVSGGDVGVARTPVGGVGWRPPPPQAVVTGATMTSTRRIERMLFMPYLLASLGLRVDPHPRKPVWNWST